MEIPITPAPAMATVLGVASEEVKGEAEAEADMCRATLAVPKGR